MSDHHLRILSHLYDRPWAITSQGLESILAVVEREGADLDAVAAKLGRPLDNTGHRVEVRGTTAILGIEGPMFRYANLFTALSGATSIELLSQDLHTALHNPSVDRILLNVDSPGGELAGVNELADMIRAANEKKPVIAYIDGLGASAAYWLAAAAGRIAANESAFIGSIGVVASMTDSRGAQERQGVKRYEIVSSQSPRKRPDPATEEGRAQLLEMVDAAAELFIGKVAAFRGVTAEKVLTSFGGGQVFHARRAQAAGMIDEVSSFEGLLAALNDRTNSTQVAAAAAKERTMQDPNPAAPAAPPNPPPAAAAPVAPAPPAAAAPPAAPAPPVDVAAAERARITAILTCPEAQGRETLARTLACETSLDLASAQRILASAPVGSAAQGSELERQMAKLKNPAVGAGAPEDDSPQAEANRVLAFVPESRRVKQRAG